MITLTYSVALSFLLLGTAIESSLPLFKAYPQLEQKVSHTRLGDFPTALTPSENLSRELTCTILCKRDDCSGPLQSNGTRLFGGNKVRKLEFVLADAQAKGNKQILTFGSAGSNHALATSCYAQKLGIATRALLGDQPVSWVVRRNLLLQAYYGTDLVHTTDRAEATILNREELRKKNGSEPYVIPPGASVPLGAVGYINAVYELQEQCNMHEIEYLYVPSGSFGTVVGLLIGLQLIGAKIKVCAVAVEAEPILAPIRHLFEQTRDLLISLDSSFETIMWNDQQLEIYDSFVGEGYGAATAETAEAIALFKSLQGLILEDTYSAKAAAALISDARKGKIHGKKVIFLQTFYGEDCKELCDSVSYTELPKEFHLYFQS